ncbi:MAG TPA: hypothetical protein VGI97_14725 [Gemmatimonadaceae bacterium]
MMPSPLRYPRCGVFPLELFEFPLRDEPVLLVVVDIHTEPDDRLSKFCDTQRPACVRAAVIRRVLCASRHHQSPST